MAVIKPNDGDRFKRDEDLKKMVLLALFPEVAEEGEGPVWGNGERIRSSLSFGSCNKGTCISHVTSTPKVEEGGDDEGEEEIGDMKNR